MAEVVGLVASIVGLIQLTGKITCLGYGYLSDVKRASNELRELVDELNSLSKVLEALQDYADKNPGSIAVQKLNDKDGPLQGCELALKELQLRMEPRGGFRGFIDNLKWPLKGSETAQFISRIERQKSLFFLALSTDNISLSKKIEQYAESTSVVVQQVEARMEDMSIAVQELRNEAIIQNQLRIAEKRKKILNWIYSGNIERKHIEISGRRRKGTGEWILATQEIQDWVIGQNNTLLWGYGIAGAGKTFLSSVVVGHLQVQALKANYGVAYIYFEYTEQDRQLPGAILASLVKQLARRTPSLPREIEALHDRSDQELETQRPSIEELYSALLEISRSFSNVFFVFDALDECNQKKQRKDLLPLIHRMHKDGFRIFLTSRQHPEDIQDSLQTATKIELSAKQEDISTYIREKIEENPRTKRLVRQGKCQDRIIADLVNCANGMFLLVYFHIEYLCQQPTVRQIMKELEKLKNFSMRDSPLNPTYDRAMEILRKQNKSCVELALKILSWLVKARRTLTVKELREAVSVESERYELEEFDLPEGITILDVCVGLVTIDENSGIIRLAHYTVKEYLLENSIISEDADLEIAICCTTYLSFDIFAAEGACESYDSYKARIYSHPFLEYAACNLAFHLKVIDESLSTDIILRFLQSPGSTSSYLQATHYGEDTTHAYPRYYPKGRSPLHVASSLGHLSAVIALLGRGDSVSFQDSVGCTALCCAAYEGHEAIVRLLLERNTNFSVPNKLTGRTALHHAVWNGHETVIKLLLDKGADLLTLDTKGSSPLHIAASNGQEKVVRLLLDLGIDVSLANKSGHTALQVAVISGHESVVRLFLERNGADSSVLDNEGRTLMHLAVIGGNEGMVELLLEKGADFSASHKDGRTPLHIAALYSYIEMVRILLDRGADTSIRDNGGMTALFLVLSLPDGDINIARLLLENGADMTLPASNGLTPLHFVAALGREEAVKLLLEKGADVSILDGNGLTARAYAQFAGHTGVLKLVDAA